MTLAAARKAGARAVTAPARATVGADLLSLISTAMYVEPLTIYREYVQNAADAIDDARARGLLTPGEQGTIEVEIEPAVRTIRLRDNGTGLSNVEFGRRMRALGGSGKRGTSARGFRGVGRLVGLAYAQQLTFRSRASASEPVLQLAWDCRRLRAGLKQHTDDDLAAFVESITELTELDGEWPARFFEVELAGVVRQGDDRLLRPETVSDYLAQVAPLPFDPDFSFSTELETLLHPHLGSERLVISVNGANPLTRPYRDTVDAGVKEPVVLRELETFELPGLDGGVAAIGWLAHHDYVGAIPKSALIKGLRVRVGDIQVGGSSLLQEIFPETRFCSWTVGEVHVLDSRIVPNGRRDGFEQNLHYANLLNQLGPKTSDVGRRCRTSSAERQRRRTFEAQAVSIDQQLDILAQGALGEAASTEIARSAELGITRLEKAAGPYDEGSDERQAMRARTAAQRERLSGLPLDNKSCSPFERLPADKREAYKEIVDLIYECSVNRVAARALVDRMLEKLASR